MKKKTAVILAGIGIVALGAAVLKNRKPVQVGSLLTQDPSHAPIEPVSVLEKFVSAHPSDSTTPKLQRIATVLKANPSVQHTALGEAVARTLQDGNVSAQESALIDEAATLAEQKDISLPVLQNFAAKYSHVAAVATPAVDVQSEATSSATPKPAASITAAASVINRYIEKNPTAKNVSQLRRLSSAAKARPSQSQALVENVARRLEDGTMSKQDAAALEQAVELAEKEGLSPSEMAEFSRKYAEGVGLSAKPVSAILEKKVAAPLPSFEGKRPLVYTFTGYAQCAQTACTHVQVSVRVTSGKWVETRSEKATDQGYYSLQLPILSQVNEKVQWKLEAYSKDLRKAELQGERVTTARDKEISLQNNLTLNPA